MNHFLSWSWWIISTYGISLNRALVIFDFVLEYCESRAVPSLEESEYLNLLGKKLLPLIHVLWTGPRVISRLISVEDAERVAKVIRRPCTIWDNLHANDYDNRRVFLGPYTGRSTELRKVIDGVLTNPNCECEANFIAIHTLAAWSRSDADAKVENGKPFLSFYTPASHCIFDVRMQCRQFIWTLISWGRVFSKFSCEEWFYKLVSLHTHVKNGG